MTYSESDTDSPRLGPGAVPRLAGPAAGRRATAGLLSAAARAADTVTVSVPVVVHLGIIMVLENEHWNKAADRVGGCPGAHESGVPRRAAGYHQCH